MGFFYLEEHTSCNLYSKCIKEGFSLRRLEKGEICEDIAPRNTIVFVLSGALELSCGSVRQILEVNCMSSFQRGSLYQIIAIEDSYMILSQFDELVSSCEKLVLSNLITSNGNNNQRIIPSLCICPNLKLFLNLLTRYLEDGANCIHFHEIKMKELFWVLRFYYTKEQLAMLFSYLIGANYSFRSRVLKYYKQVRSVKELAVACGYSLASFKREFNKEFRIPPGQWLQQHVIGTIKYRLLDDTVPLCDIVDELNFSSMSHFSIYCKQKFGYTPKEYRLILKNSVLQKKETYFAGSEPHV